MSWYDSTSNINFDSVFSPLEWSIKLNKLCFQCLAIRDWLIFPLRIITIKYIESALTFSFNKDKLKFCGYFHTNFTDNYNGNNNFNIECRDKFYFIYHYTSHTENLSGKDYRLYYYTGNNIWFEMSIVPYYKIILCEINWIYYTFILKYNTIPYFYKYINDYCEEEIVVSRFSLDEIYCKYEENCYDVSELNDLKEVFYNHNFYKGKTEKEEIFVDIPLLQSVEEKKEFKDYVFRRKKFRV
jgi:hypothetical protein